MTYEEALNIVIHGKYAEADEMIIQALQRQIPQNPVFGATKKYKNIFDGSEVEVHELESCPVCGCYPLETNYVRLKSCPKCNQRIDWGEEE